MAIETIDSWRLMELLAGILLLVFALISFSDDRKLKGIILTVLGGILFVDVVINGFTI